MKKIKKCGKTAGMTMTLLMIPNNEKSLSEPPFLNLGVMYALHLLLVGKPVVNFLCVIIEFSFAISYG